MNILTEPLPAHVEIGGLLFPINTDFRVGIEFEIITQKNNQDIAKWFELYFEPGNYPLHDIEGAVNALMWFYRCGNQPTKEEKPTHNKIPYSFAVDSEVIFADFWQYYNIDLSQEGLHWWVFRALLFGLPDESSFKQRVYYRTCDTKGLSKKEKERIMKIRKTYEIRDDLKEEITLEERNAKMLKYLEKRREDIKKGGEVNG